MLVWMGLDGVDEQKRDSFNANINESLRCEAQRARLKSAKREPSKAQSTVDLIRSPTETRRAKVLFKLFEYCSHRAYPELATTAEDYLS